MSKLSPILIVLLAILLPALVFAQAGKSQFVDINLRQGTNMAIALSPDEKTLALDLQGTIWTMSAPGGKATAITNDLGDCHEPAWSPDGQYLAFHSYRSGTYHIWTVKKDGSELREITSGVFDDREPCWSPDGKTIIFSSDRSGNYDLWQADLLSGQVKQLTNTPVNEYNPAVSPDGKKIAFVSEGVRAGIYIMEGSNASLISPSTAALSAPSWSKDGNLLSYVASEREVIRINLINVGDKTTTEISSSEDVFPFRASWMSDGSFLYTANGQIRKRNPVGETNFSAVPFEASIRMDRSAYKRRVYNFDDKSSHRTLGIMGPVASPDGNSVAFTALGDIYIQKIGKQLTQLTHDSFVDLDADWSPDGNTLAFVSDRTGKMEIWLHDLRTGTEKMINTGLPGNAAEPVWSPDGRKIAFYIKEMNEWGRGILYLISSDGSNLQKLNNGVFVPGKPSWSADGRTLAVMGLQPSSSRFREGLNRFMLIAADGGSSHFVSPDQDESPGIRGQDGPVWSPDGTQMAYVQDGVLWTVPVNSKGDPAGQPKQLTKELSEKLSWTGDSKSIVYLATDRLKKINIITGKSKEITVKLNWKAQIPAERYVIHAGRVFNGIDSTYQTDMDILIQSNRIVRIYPHEKHVAGLDVVDASTDVVMPGLIESHSHQHASEGEKLGKIWLSNGITSVREPGADPYDGLERKESWASGMRPGPRLFTGGLLDGSRVYYGLSNTVVKKPHLRMEFERMKKLGYDMVKTYARMPDSLQMEIIKAAHKIGIPVSSHEIYPAARYNIDAVEHFRGTSRRGYSPKQSVLNYIYDDVIQIISKSKMPVTPTVVMHEGFLKLIKGDSKMLENRQFSAYYPKAYLDSWGNRPARTNYGPNFTAFTNAVNAVLNGGGVVTAGTDSPFVPYGTSLHAELWLYVDGGLSPFRTLQTGTIRAAEAIGVGRDLGSIEKGKLADLVIIKGDPLKNIRDSWNVVMTIKNGIRYPLEELLHEK